MASVNKVILVGNLGRDPEVRYSPDGRAMANITIATSSYWTDKNTNERREETEWHRIAFFGRQAEVVAQYLKKGSAVYVEGRLKTRKWTDKDGIDRYSTDVIADSMQMLGGRASGGGFDEGGQGGYSQGGQGSGYQGGAQGGSGSYGQGGGRGGQGQSGQGQAGPWDDTQYATGNNDNGFSQPPRQRNPAQGMAPAPAAAPQPRPAAPASPVADIGDMDDDIPF